MQVLRYAARFAADWVCLEALTHCLYFNSIAKHRIGLRYTQYGLRYGTVEMGERGAVPGAFMPQPAAGMVSDIQKVGQRKEKKKLPGTGVPSDHRLFHLLPTADCRLRPRSAAGLLLLLLLCLQP